MIKLQEAAGTFSLGAQSLRRLSVTAFKDYAFKGTKPRLDSEQQQRFKASLSDDSAATLAQAAARKQPVCKMKLGYAYSYLYTALCPFEGHLLSLILSDMTKERFGVFLDYFKEQTEHLYGRAEKVLLLTDGTGAHQPAFVQGTNITLKKLPAASPEFNPVERFFQELRKALSNQVFATPEAVEDRLCQVLQQYYQHKHTIVTLCNFPSLNLIEIGIITNFPKQNYNYSSSTV